MLDFEIKCDTHKEKISSKKVYSYKMYLLQKIYMK